MSDVLIVVSKVISKEIVGKTFLEIMFFLGTIQKEGPSLLEHAEGVARAGIGLMNADKKGHTR